ncbi:MAG: redoxin domain-containing protein [Pyrinomonadaceae bacterium]|nr:redoxin domain-containing protein [Pyrinomonadaceae bacterium]
MELVSLRFARRGMPGRRVLGIGLGIGFIVTLALAGKGWTTEPLARAQSSDVDYETELQKGLDLVRRRKYEESLKVFKRANEMRDKKSAECFLGMAGAYHGLGAYKNTIESCDKVILFAGNNSQLQAQAYNLKGLALQAQAELKNQKKLQEAEAAFRQGLSLGVNLPILHYNLGFTLMQLGRDPEGLVELKKYLELDPTGNHAEEARKLIDNPRRAREAYAPDFSITTADGEYITLEDLRGKVVVLDFWGTWCPPCVESVPSLRNLHKKYSKEPSFAMIGISSDTEEATWRAFTNKEKMVWPQYWDRDRRIQRAFDVRAFPTYIVIDHEGIMRFRSSGTSWERSASLEDAIQKQVKIVAKAAPTD